MCSQTRNACILVNCAEQGDWLYDFIKAKRRSKERKLITVNKMMKQKGNNQMWALCQRDFCCEQSHLRIARRMEVYSYVFGDRMSHGHYI